MKSILFCFILLIPVLAISQNKARIIDWDILSDVKFEDQYYDEFEAWYLTPVFSDHLKDLDGKQVVIKGYIIPLDVDGERYALSAYPFSACFFCGGAGPETVMSLRFKESPRKYKTDEVITLRGKLILNSTELDEFTYILEQAVDLD